MAKDTRVVRVPLRFANSYLVIGDKTIIVDTGDPGFSRGILKALQRNGISKKDVSMIFITHGHIDHYGSVYVLKQHIDAPVAIQQIDEPYLLKGVQAPLYPTNRVASFIKAVGQDMQVKKRYNLQADIVFDEELDLAEYGVNGLLLATPGHTLGSASLFLPDGQAVTGDLVIRRNLFWGPPEKCPFLHDPEKFQTSLEKLISRGVKVLHPGHGGPIPAEQIYRLRR
jgi:glyoxylase-like metal-dependent hydrolase (beta-lactamase superfamily II)